MHYDAHIHSAASPDSELNPVDAIKALKRKGLGTIFTEHVDYITPQAGKDLKATDAPQGVSDFVCDFEIYPAQYRPLNKEYGDWALLGLEIGLTAAYYPANSQLAKGNYDFILGSVHHVDGLDIYSQSNKQDPKTFLARYLTYSKEMVEYCDFFDSLGHIDYVARYSDGIYKIYEYKNCPAEFDALLTALAERDMAIEINTSRLGDNNFTGRLLPIYKRFKELGGRYVTIGSDAHNEYSLGRGYRQALGIASMAGLTPVYFIGRERRVCE